MDTTTLRTFIALAQIKNFTKTAQQLFVAQSTVTNRIRDLEMELGQVLEQFFLALDGDAAVSAQGVSEESQFALGRNVRVELAQ